MSTPPVPGGLSHDHARARVVEVVATFASTIIDVAHVGSKARRGARHAQTLERYTIGEHAENCLQVAGEGLPTPGAFTLVGREGGEYWFEFTAQMRGTFEFEGQRVSLAALVAEGAERGVTARGDRLRAPLPPGAVVWVVHQGARFRLRNVAREGLVLTRGRRDRLWSGCVSACVGVGVALVALMSSLPADLLARDLELEPVDPRPYLYPVDPALNAAREPVRGREVNTSGDGPRGAVLEPALTLGSRRGAREAEGRAGEEARRLMPLPSRPPLTSVDRLGAPEGQTYGDGLLALTGTYAERFAAAGLHAYTPEVDDREQVWESTRAELSAAYGVGGLGLVGVGRAGGGWGDGTIAFGNTGLLGALADGGHRPRSWAHSHQACSAPHHRPVPLVRLLETTTQGSYSTSLARRIVRAHVNELRGCFNGALTRDPGVQGSVRYSFVIGVDGRVSVVVTETSTLGAPGLERCMANAIRRWRFARPSNGLHVTIQQSLSLGMS